MGSSGLQEVRKAEKSRNGLLEENEKRRKVEEKQPGTRSREREKEKNCHDLPL